MNTQGFMLEQALRAIVRDAHESTCEARLSVAEQLIEEARYLLDNLHLYADVETTPSVCTPDQDEEHRKGWRHGLRDALSECEVVMSEDPKHAEQLTYTTQRIREVLDGKRVGQGEPDDPQPRPSEATPCDCSHRDRCERDGCKRCCYCGVSMQRTNEALQAGDRVRLRDLRGEGVVSSIDGDKAKVKWDDGLRMEVQPRYLERCSDNPRPHDGSLALLNDGSETPPPLANDELRTCWCHECLDAPEHGLNNPTVSRMILCPACGNKRCPRASDHRFACTGSNEPGQFGSHYGSRPWTETPMANPVAVLRGWLCTILEDADTLDEVRAWCRRALDKEDCPEDPRALPTGSTP